MDVEAGVGSAPDDVEEEAGVATPSHPMGQRVEDHPEYLEKADLSFLPTTSFTFLLDLSEPVGLDIIGARRHGKRVAVVSSVSEDSQGVLAGIKPRSIVTRVGDTRVFTPEEFEVRSRRPRNDQTKLEPRLLLDGHFGWITPMDSAAFWNSAIDG